MIEYHLLKLKKQDIRLLINIVDFVLMLQEQIRQVVQMYSSDEQGNIAQEWELDYNNDDYTYIIKSALTGKALDMGGWSQDNGGNAIIWVINKTANQRWYITQD